MATDPFYNHVNCCGGGGTVGAAVMRHGFHNADLVTIENNKGRGNDASGDRSTGKLNNLFGSGGGGGGRGGGRIHKRHRVGSQTNEVNDILVKAQMSLKLTERQAVEEDIHGVASAQPTTIPTNPTGADGVRRDCHVGAIISETPELLDQALREFQAILHHKYVSDPSHSDVKAYNLAIQNEFTYVTDDNKNLRLMFIRATRFEDHPAAVEKFLTHLNVRLEFYGIESLSRPLRLDDLKYKSSSSTCCNGRSSSSMSTTSTSSSSSSPSPSPSPSSLYASSTTTTSSNYNTSPGGGTGAYKYFKSGAFQILPWRDRAGRRVTFHDCNVQPNHTYTLYDEIKALVYVFTVLFEFNDDVQQKGVVHIAHAWSRRFDPRQMLAGMKHYSDSAFVNRALVGGSPLRYAAIHILFCDTNELFNKIAKVNIESLGSDAHYRVRLHQSASILELQYRLLSFGLPMEDDVFPLTYNGELKTKNHLAWMKCRQAMDEMMKSSSTSPSLSSWSMPTPSVGISYGCVPVTFVECPMPRDVLLCRNHKRARRCDGNQELQRLMDLHQATYVAAPKRSDRRDDIVRDLIKEITTVWKGRFLSWNAERQWWDHLPPNLDDPLVIDDYTCTNTDLVARIRKKFWRNAGER